MMAVGLKDICALIAAAGIGAGGAVTVQKTTAPAVEKSSKVRPARATGKQPLQVRRFAPVAPLIFDCPLPSAELGGLADFSTVAGGFHGFQPGGLLRPYPDGWIGGGVMPPAPPPTFPAVPEPSVWLQLIAGFGLIGTSARWRARKAVKP